MAGDSRAELADLVARCEADPNALPAIRERGDALAADAERDISLRWHVAVIHALMAEPPDGDAVREAYGELVDRFRGDAASLAVIKPLGDEIRRRESDGSLASVLVARSDRRPKG